MQRGLWCSYRLQAVFWILIQAFIECLWKKTTFIARVMMAHNFNPSTWKAEAGTSLRVQGHLGLQNEFWNSSKNIVRPPFKTKQKRIHCLYIFIYITMFLQYKWDGMFLTIYLFILMNKLKCFRIRHRQNQSPPSLYCLLIVQSWASCLQFQF